MNAQSNSQLEIFMALFLAGYETTCEIDGSVTVKDPIHGYAANGRYGVQDFAMVRIKTAESARRFINERS